MFIAVGTPSRRGDGLSLVYEAVRVIAPLLAGAAVVITKSTVPVGTGVYDLGASVRGYDPAGMEQAKAHLPFATARTSTTRRFRYVPIGQVRVE
jgi:UDP-glucose 6-dehydrogenase